MLLNKRNVDRRRKKIFTPVQIIALGFAITIVVGAILLRLPIATIDRVRTPIIDCLFTATSAVCVTGLVVVDTGTYWSYFGKTVIMLLIQIGGLGFMSFAALFSLILGKRITLSERLIIRESFNSNSLQGVVKLVRYILTFTFSIEAIGAVLLSFKFIPQFGLLKGIYYSIFHAVSAFCNAGFDLMGHFTSLTAYSSSALIILTISALIVIGGLGFYVWDEVYHYKRNRRFSLHTKVVMLISGVLIVFGFVMIFIFETTGNGMLKDAPFKEKVLSSLFASISPRTAGFNSIDLTKMTMASTLLTIMLMFIGGSPGSTAGGVKTSTVGILALTVISVIRGREDAEVFNRRINKETVYKAFAVVAVGMMIVFTTTIILTISERGLGLPFECYLYEAASAFGTVGLSLGLTPKLSVVGKIVVALTMYCGRVGPLTILIALAIRKKRINNSIRYPEDKILVG